MTSIIIALLVEAPFCIQLLDTAMRIGILYRPCLDILGLTLFQGHQILYGGIHHRQHYRPFEIEEKQRKKTGISSAGADLTQLYELQNADTHMYIRTHMCIQRQFIVSRHAACVQGECLSVCQCVCLCLHVYEPTIRISCIAFHPVQKAVILCLSRHGEKVGLARQIIFRMTTFKKHIRRTCSYLSVNLVSPFSCIPTLA